MNFEECLRTFGSGLFSVPPGFDFRKKARFIEGTKLENLAANPWLVYNKAGDPIPVGGSTTLIQIDVSDMVLTEEIFSPPFYRVRANWDGECEHKFYPGNLQKLIGEDDIYESKFVSCPWCWKEKGGVAPILSGLSNKQLLTLFQKKWDLEALDSCSIKLSNLSDRGKYLFLMKRTCNYLKGSNPFSDEKHVLPSAFSILGEYVPYSQRRYFALIITPFYSKKDLKRL